MSESTPAPEPDVPAEPDPTLPADAPEQDEHGAFVEEQPTLDESTEDPA